MARFAWTPQTEKAAVLIAQAKLKRWEIAEQVGVDERTLLRWLKRDDFSARVIELAEDIAAEVRRIGISSSTARVRALNDRWNRMQRVIEARAEHPDYQNTPGGDQGVLIRRVKRISVEHDDDQRPTTREIEEFEFDHRLLKEIREIERQAAQELGQWLIKVETSDPKANDAADTPEAKAAIAAAKAVHDQRSGRLDDEPDSEG